jgi:hypothetical protein
VNIQAGQSAYVAQSHQGVNRFEQFSPLQQKIANVIAQGKEDGDGIHITAIARSIGGNAETLKFVFGHFESCLY